MVMRRLASVVVLAIALAPLSARAAGPAPAKPKRASKAAEAKKDDGRVEFDRAMQLFQAGQYAEAKPLFERAYELSGRRASSIRALAQCERALGENARAIRLFREYLATTPRPSDASAIEETIATLTRLEDERRTAPTPPIAGSGSPASARDTATAPRPAASDGAAVVATPTAVDDAAAPRADHADVAPPLVATAPPRRETRWAPIVGVGASALVTAGGATLLILGQSDASAVEDAAPGTPFADVRDAADRAPALMTAGTVVAGAGAVALAATIYWLVSSE